MMKSKKFFFAVLVFFAVSAAVYTPGALWAGAKKESAPAGTSAGNADPVTNELLIYSVINEDQIKALSDLFTRQTGVKVSYFRAATGDLVSRVKAEQGNPQADILIGGDSSYYSSLAAAGALDPYTPKTASSIPAYTRAADGSWTGFTVLTLGIGINEQRFKEKYPGKAYPQTWDDLNDQAYKGELIFTDPAASSTGYLFLQSQLQRFGDDRGWDYFKKITPLASQLPASGGAPPRLIGTGEAILAVSYVHPLQQNIAQGFPLKIIIPPKTVASFDALSVIKGGPNRANAQRFVDFILSKEAQELFTSLSYSIPVNPEAKPLEGAISIDKLDVLDYDSDLAGSQRDAALVRWQNEVLK
jgi:iron(III) transport system substrate-binding protein